MTITAPAPRPTRAATSAADERPVGGPVPHGWREGTLTRAAELEALAAWVVPDDPHSGRPALANAIDRHLRAARQAARSEQLDPRRRFHFFRNGALLERARSNLDAAEALLLNCAPTWYVLGQLPCLLANVQSHLVANDPRRLELERIARRVGIKDADHPLAQSSGKDPTSDPRPAIIDQERGKIVSAMRAACSAALREQVRLRSFRNTLIATSIFMTLLAIGIATAGLLNPTMIPLCFAPEDGGQALVVCPTAQSAVFSTSAVGAADTSATGTTERDIDNYVQSAARGHDLLVVELVGLAAAAIAAAAGIRGIRGSSERCGLPVAMALLKLPTGAVTAFLGLLLMRGQFVPGLSALDTSAQILAWALVFGYAQQLFTRLVDRQGHTVLDSVRGADKVQPLSPPS